MSNDYYERSDPADGNDGKPWGSHIAIDLIHARIIKLMKQSPARSSFIFPGTDYRTTAATTYTDASWLIRFNIAPILASYAVLRPRWWTFECYVAVSGGATCAIRATSSQGFRAIADPPVAPDLEGEATGIVSSTGEWKTVSVHIDRANQADCHVGRFTDDPVRPYGAVYVGVQGRITAGAGTISLISYRDQQDDPT